MKRSGPLRRSTALARGAAPLRTRPPARPVPTGRAEPARDEREAREKLRREGKCRACGVLRTRAVIQMAHLIGRRHDVPHPERPGLRWVNPDEVCPLCALCHDRYDGRQYPRLDLVPYLTSMEQAACVARLGLVAALRRLSCGELEIHERTGGLDGRDPDGRLAA